MFDDKHVKAFIRIRPTSNFANQMIEFLPDGKSLNIHAKKDERRGYINNQILDWKFSFDGVLHNVSQEEVYNKCASQLVTMSLDGYNGTIFAYGETGAGKTFTVTGTTNDFKQRGIIPRSLTQLYREIKDRYEYDITVRISYIEIYQENMYDLLATMPKSRENGYSEEMTVTEDVNSITNVKGLSCHIAKSEEEALNLLFEGETNRIISHHQLNRQSSRSHCIFTIFIESHSRTESNATFTISKLNLVDLAGSERLGKTKSEGQTREEAMYINKSLTFLEQTIIALAERKREHIPFRQSKLTHVLKDSLGKACQTVMIGNIWGEASQIEETLSTLRFACRVMCVPNEAAINAIQDPFRQCRVYEREIASLRRELAMYDTLTNRGQINYEPLSETQIQEIKDQVRKFVDGEIQEIDIINVRQVKEVFEQFKSLVGIHEPAVAPTPGKKQSIGDKKEAIKGSRVKSGVGFADDSSLVGETDGQGFGLGVAPNSVRLSQPSTVTLAKKTKSKKGKPDSSGGEHKRSPSPQLGADSKPVQQTDETQGRNSSPVQVAVTAQTPPIARTPPPKTEAFEQFKQERGNELNRVLTDNKDILRNKKSEAKDTTNKINQIKREIDVTKATLEEITHKKSGQEEFDEFGEPIIDEEDFLLLKKLKELKLKYRTEYEHLQNLRSDITYCEKLVQQCRQRLLVDFNAWYIECFLPADDDGSRASPQSDGLISRRKSMKQPEDEQEKFDRLQMELLTENPESVPFYNAKLQTERRQLFNSQKRKPGQLSSEIRNKPPGTLVVR